MFKKVRFNDYGVVTEYYYTLYDLMGLCSGTISTKLFDSTPLADIVTNNFSSKVGNGYYNTGTYASRLWNRILAKYETNFITYTNKELTNTDTDLIWVGFRKIITRIEETCDKYQPLLNKLYEANLDLFGKIKSKTTNDGTNKFNDTPQDVDVSLDNYLSNVTKTNNTMESETDGENIVNRIREYMDKMSNILDEWVKEFNELFIESLNVW